jgi:hypothetical protein
MASSDISALLIEAPVNRHFAQLHRDTRSLTEAVGLFAETGLRRGNGVVAIATPDHTERLLERLAQNGLDPEEFRRSGQLEILDAEAVLARFMHGDKPDWTDFKHTVGTVLEGVQACSAPLPGTWLSVHRESVVPFVGEVLDGEM